ARKRPRAEERRRARGPDRTGGDDRAERSTGRNDAPRHGPRRRDGVGRRRSRERGHSDHGTDDGAARRRREASDPGHPGAGALAPGPCGGAARNQPEDAIPEAAQLRDPELVEPFEAISEAGARRRMRFARPAPMESRRGEPTVGLVRFARGSRQETRLSHLRPPLAGRGSGKCRSERRGFRGTLSHSRKLNPSKQQRAPHELSLRTSVERRHYPATETRPDAAYASRG